MVVADDLRVKGAKSDNDLRAVNTPAPTESHVPVAHHEIVELMRYTLGFYDHEIVQEDHAIMPGWHALLRPDTQEVHLAITTTSSIRSSSSS